MKHVLVLIAVLVAQTTIHLNGLRYVADPPNGREAAKSAVVHFRPEIPAGSLEVRPPLANYRLTAQEVAPAPQSVRPSRAIPFTTPC